MLGVGWIDLKINFVTMRDLDSVRARFVEWLVLLGK